MMSAHEQANWHYVSSNKESLGPFTIRELSSLASQGAVGPKTLVWCEGSSDWIFADQIADLLSEAQKSIRSESEPAAVSVRGSEALPAVTAPIASSTSTSKPIELKPRKGSFVFPRIVAMVVIWAVIGAVVSGVLVGLGKPAWPGLLLFVVGDTLGIFAILMAFRKERYEIHEKRVLCHRGGLFSDQTTELEVRNITHVKVKLPWLRFKLFGVGDVIVETAGNSKPVVMRVIREPEAIYAEMRVRMQKNGYDLTQKQLLHEEKPAVIGIIGECLGLLFGVFIAAAAILPAIAVELSESMSAPAERALSVILGLVVLILIAWVTLRFLDLRRRTYQVYNDVVVYEEGFLTRENAFIPYENIADANTKCTFFDRILSLYDVEVSCQGSGSNIKFRRLRHGVALSAAIDQLVVNARQKPKPGARAAQDGEKPALRAHQRRAEPEMVPLEETLVADLGMNAGRLLVPLLFLLPLFPIWILAMIQSVVRLMSTRYAVRPGSLRHTYRFLTVHDREFAYDKITGLVIKQNLWDRLFNTMTLRFWSIGSGQPLEFAHVHANQLDLPALMRQVGIPPASLEPYNAEASFALGTWLRARLTLLPVVLIFAAGSAYAGLRVDEHFYYLLLLPLLIAVGGFFYAKLYYTHQNLRFHDHHVEAGHGIISKSRYYARYGNIKRNKVTRYPGGEEGSLEIFVAGEEEVQFLKQQGTKKQTLLKPCSFTTGMLSEVAGAGLLLDDILCGRVEPTSNALAAEPLEVLSESPRSVGNALVKLILLSIVLFPLIVLLPLTIPLTVLRMKRWRYRIESARIVVSWGILYRSETSVLLDRVDSLQQSQGLLNKMFKNGNVSIMTAGSSKPDLNLSNSPGYLGLYQEIREYSQ